MAIDFRTPGRQLLLFVFLLLAGLVPTFAQGQRDIVTDNWQMHINPSGTLDKITFGSGFTALFNKAGKGGEVAPAGM